jgi:hypothetical protein
MNRLARIALAMLVAGLLGACGGGGEAGGGAGEQLEQRDWDAANWTERARGIV